MEITVKKIITENLIFFLGTVFLLLLIIINLVQDKFHFIQIYGIFGILAGSFFLNRFYKNKINYAPISELIFIIYITYYFILSYFLYEIHPVYKDISITDLYLSTNIFMIFVLIFAIHLYFQNNFFKKNIKIYKLNFFKTSKYTDILILITGITLFILNRSNILTCKDLEYINNDLQIIIQTIAYFGSFISLFGFFNFYLKISKKPNLYSSVFFIFFLSFFCLLSISSSGSANFAILIVILASIFYTINLKKIPWLILMSLPLVLSLLSVKDIVRINLDPGPKQQCTNFIYSTKILGSAYKSFYFETVEYRDEENNLIKRTNFTEDTPLQKRVNYSIFRIFERLDNSYLFAQTVKKIPNEVNYFNFESYKWESDKEWKLHYGQQIGVIAKTQMGSAFNFPILIESYANMGFIGVILFSIFFILFLFLFNYILVKIDSNAFRVLSIVSFSHFFFIENRLIFSLKQSLYTFISIILIILLFKFLEFVCLKSSKLFFKKAF